MEKSNTIEKNCMKPFLTRLFFSLKDELISKKLSKYNQLVIFAP